MSNIRAAIGRLYDLSDPLDPIDERAIEEFEAEIGARLPDDYREFLLLQNGGHLHFHTEFGDFGRMPYGDLGIETLFGLGEEQGHDELRWYRQEFRGRIHDEWLAFGEAATWLHYCLSLHADDYGVVWVWNREGSDLLPLQKSAICLHCTFEEFLMRLQPSEQLFDLTRTEATAAAEPLRSILLYDLPSLKHHLADGGTMEGRDIYMRTPLMVAIDDWPNVVPLLLEHGAEVEARGPKGITALLHAIGSIDSVRALLKYGANPFAEDNDGVTALIRATIRAQANCDFRPLKAIKARLDANGIVVDYALVEKIAYAERCTANDGGTNSDLALRRRVFFNHGRDTAYISDSEIVLVFRCHSSEETKNDIYKSSLADLMKLVPKARLYRDGASPLPATCYEICDRILEQAAAPIVPHWEGPTCGDFAACLIQLYQTVEKLTAHCKTREQALDAISPAEEQEFVARLTDSLRQVCNIRYVFENEEPRPLKVAIVDPMNARLLTSPGFSRVVIDGAGFVLSTGRMMRDKITEPTLNMAVVLEVPQIFPVDPSELSGSPRNPATYARFEICRNIFNSVANNVKIDRAEVTLDEIGDSVRQMQRTVLAESLECKSEDEVFAAITPKARENIAATLLESLTACCRRTG